LRGNCQEKGVITTYFLPKTLCHPLLQQLDIWKEECLTDQYLLKCKNSEGDGTFLQTNIRLEFDEPRSRACSIKSQIPKKVPVPETNQVSEEK